MGLTRPVSLALLETLATIVAAAGRVVLDVYKRRFEVEYKAPGDPVTAADQLANALLVRRLGEVFPGVAVVAEESPPAARAGYRRAERVFFVDPLDGTREFVDRVGEFAVMIGLAEGSRAIAGAIHAPLDELTWVGGVGVGAWQTPTFGSWTRVSVTDTAELARARIVASRSHRSARLERALAALAPREVRTMGSAGLKGAAVARGAADAYIDTGAKTKRWDACAVDAVVTAAGGRVSDLDGAPIDYRGRHLVNDRGLVVTNGRLHDAVLTVIGG